jgi:hypothetical protein
MIRTGTERLPNNSIQWTTLRAASDLERWNDHPISASQTSAEVAS